TAPPVYAHPFCPGSEYSRILRTGLRARFYSRYDTPSWQLSTMGWKCDGPAGGDVQGPNATGRLRQVLFRNAHSDRKDNARPQKIRGQSRSRHDAWRTVRPSFDRDVTF